MLIDQNRETPSLGGFAYQAQRFIDAGSKMSDILLAVDQKNRPVILKIACVDQRSRAEANRMAIKNTVEWLQRLGRHRGMIGLRAIEQTGVPRWRSWLAGETCCGVLADWPGQPEFLVMDYLAGGSLRDYADGKPLNVKLALWIAHHVAQTLAYLHRQGCVHRDLKPENILFRTLPDANATPARAMPILIDFGVAAEIGQERLVSGSRLWMAPELQEAYERHPLPVDPAWDVYALGLILCYMICGRRHRNYDRASYEDFREQAFAQLDSEAEDTAAMPPAIKTRLKQLIGQALARTAAERLTAQRFAAESAQLLAEMGAPMGLREQLLMRVEQYRRLPDRRGRVLGVAAALLGLGLLLLVFVGQGGLSLAGFALSAGDQPLFAEATGQTPASAALFSPGLLAAVNGANGPHEGEADFTAGSPTPASAAAAAPTPLSEEPTRVSLTATATKPAPTRIAWTPTATDPLPTRPARTTPVANPPPTLALPTLAATATKVAPTLAPLASPTATATRAAPTPAPPTAIPLAQPTNTVRPAATQTPAATPTATQAPLGRVELLSPESGVTSSQTKVEFQWQMTQQPLAGDHCFELVFWDPANPADKRSPVGAGKEVTGRVDFGLLAASQDPLLSKLARTEQEFRWGVRLVLCDSPRTAVRDVEEERVYKYDG